MRIGLQDPLSYSESPGKVRPRHLHNKGFGIITQRGNRRQVERRASREERIEKAQERRFVKSLTDARDTLDEVIEKAERSSALTLDTLEQFSDEMSEIYQQARLMDRDE